MNTPNTSFARHWKRRLAGALAVVGLGVVGLIAVTGGVTGTTNDDSANPTEAYCLYDAVLFDTESAGMVISDGSEFTITGGMMHPRVDVTKNPSDDETLCGYINTMADTALQTSASFTITEAVLDTDSAAPQLFMRVTSSSGAEAQGTLEGVDTGDARYVFAGSLFDEDDGSAAMELVDYELIAV
ncbi:MAG: hypothetical protein AAGF73_16960 [Actinomycetota bacterium]